MNNTSLSTLNDFIFCPYSIYKKGRYMEADKEIEILILSRARQTHTLHARNDIQIEVVFQKVCLQLAY